MSTITTMISRSTSRTPERGPVNFTSSDGSGPTLNWWITSSVLIKTFPSGGKKQKIKVAAVLEKWSWINNPVDQVYLFLLEVQNGLKTFHILPQMIKNVTYEKRKAFLNRWPKKKCCLHAQNRPNKLKCGPWGRNGSKNFYFICSIFWVRSGAL